jgi:hypothetical protein
MIRAILLRWANETARERIEDLEERLKERDSTIRIQEMEIEELVAVVKRNHLRVKSEMADFAAKVVGHENETDEQRRLRELFDRG